MLGPSLLMCPAPPHQQLQLCHPDLEPCMTGAAGWMLASEGETAHAQPHATDRAGGMQTAAAHRAAPLHPQTCRSQGCRWLRWPALPEALSWSWQLQRDSPWQAVGRAAAGGRRRHWAAPWTGAARRDNADWCLISAIVTPPGPWGRPSAQNAAGVSRARLSATGPVGVIPDRQRP